MSGADRRGVFRAVPLTLALAMLVVVVIAGLLPDTGVVRASSNCTYGKCPASTAFPLWAVSAAVVVVVIALILALLLLRRNRRRPPASPSPPASTDVAEGAPASGTQWSEEQPASGQWEESPETDSSSDASAPGEPDEGQAQ